MIFAVIGFLLIKLPYVIVTAIYGGVPECSSDNSTLWRASQICAESSKTVDLTGTVDIVAKIFTFINSFLVVLSVILIIYA